MDTQRNTKLKEITSIAEFDFDPIRSNFGQSENHISN